jgi:hypothetical protein
LPKGQKLMPPKVSQLDDPAYSAFAWGRYRKLMRWMTLASAVSVALALLFLKWQLGSIPWTMALFTALGVFASVLLGAALMGLVFLSSGSGHDNSIADPLEEDED